MTAVLLRFALPMGALAVLAGCASTPDQSIEQIARAEISVERAEESGARKYSVKTLETARSNLASAKKALQDGDETLAVGLAHRAELDAELAVAKAERAEADESLAEVRDSIATLQREIDRGARQ